MKLKDGFIVQEIDGEYVMVSLDSSAFHGLVRLNKTAAFILECLSEATTEKAIIDAMAAKYDAPRTVLAQNVDGILKKLRSIHALEE